MLETKLNLNEEKNPDLTDARREPPVPVERSSVTEKVPVQSQKVSDSITTLSTPKNDRIKIPEKTVFEKGVIDSQEDRRIIEKKHEQDEQVNGILINSEKNDDTEVNKDKMNPESHGKIEPEQFFKKLKEHREETRKLIEEQKELLKDIKQQKEELEMEKKKRLMERIKLIEVDRNVKSKSKELIEQKNNNFYDKTSQQTENDVKIISIESPDTRRDEKLLKPVRKTVDDEKIMNNVNTKVNSNNVTGIPNNFDNYDQNMNSVSLLNGSSIDSQGPILNILTNWTTTRNSSDSEKIITRMKSENFKKVDRQNITNSIQYELPILLRLINQTKENTQNNPINKSVEELPSTRNDILENPGREKREIELGENLNEDKKRHLDRTVVINETIAGNNSPEIKHCTDSGVKSYADLEQLKIDDKRVLKTDSINVEYQMIKKRDLKALKLFKLMI